MSEPPRDLRPLWERYVQERGRVHLTGLQALVRVLLEQVRRDRAAGRRVGALVSGYPGSPLAGLDQLLGRVAPLLESHDVRFLPGLNEELAASAVAGAQLLDLFPHARFDGVVGMWFGKAPGLDRALDALRHANFTGISRFGGALAVVGDDPFCKSSSLPSHSEHAFAHAFVPLLAPGDAAEVLELGGLGLALSRFAGLWVGLKVVADVADGGLVFELPAPREVELPKFEIGGAPFRKRLDARLLPPVVNRIEEEILWERHEAVRRFAYANRVDRIRVVHARDRIGLVASGRLYRELESALERLGLDAPALERLGLRLYQLRMLYPIEPRRLREFADGLDEIVVVDERRGFVEEQIKAALFDALERPHVIGQKSERGEPWLARHREITADTLAADLGPYLAHRLALPALAERARALLALDERRPSAQAPARDPHLCSGCPHTASTRLPTGAIAGGGIGCHTMALFMDREVRFVGAMGAEGTHWAGLAPFVDTPHLFQNLGDGTYFHSGRQAVRACVAAGARMTFKLLWNGAIAMTGGQSATGAKPLVELVRELLADGVRRVVVATGDRAVRRLARRERAVERVGVADWESALARLAHEPGVTAAVYDRLCANEKQRLERRGLRPGPTERVLIHEDVCEGCGDCGRRSECASLLPVSTALGRKTRIHESSCSDDRSCLAGDCPSFLSVATARRAPPPLEQLLPAALPDPPAPRWDRERFEISMVGVGSTGVVTVDALVVRAAELDGLAALHLDQTGLAQRGGKVVSHCILARGALAGSPRVAWGGADVLLAFDPLGAADAAGLRALDPARTRVVAHARVAPTAESVRNAELEPPALETLLAALSAHALGLEAVPAEALAEAALDEGRAANVLLLGFALQRGMVPVSAANLERAIRENGVAVEANLGALRVGRALACDASLAARLLAGARPPAAGEDGSPVEAAERLGGAWSALAPALDGMVDPEDDGALAPRVAGRALDLCEGFGPVQACRYLGALLPLARACARHGEATAPILAAAARELYRILAPKDEYEVARLLVAGPYRRWLERRSEGPLRLRYHLHPPLLRALGLRRKLALGRWVEPLLRALVAARRVRGSWLDPFAHSAVRRAERALGPWYEELLARVAQRLEPATAELALAVVSAASRIRGYEELKLSRIAAAREEADRLLARLEAG